MITPGFHPHPCISPSRKRPSIQILQRHRTNSLSHRSKPKPPQLPLCILSNSSKITRNESKRCDNNLKTQGGLRKNMQNVAVPPNGFLLKDFLWSPELAKPSSPRNGNQNWGTPVKAMEETQNKNHLDRKTTPDHRCLQSSWAPSHGNQLNN